MHPPAHERQSEPTPLNTNLLFAQPYIEGIERQEECNEAQHARKKSKTDDEHPRQDIRRILHHEPNPTAESGGHDKAADGGSDIATHREEEPHPVPPTFDLERHLAAPQVELLQGAFARHGRRIRINPARVLAGGIDGDREIPVEIHAWKIALHPQPPEVIARVFLLGFRQLFRDVETKRKACLAAIG